MTDGTAGWQPDPTGKHDHRYWDGSQWTDNVADAGVASTDPYDAAATAAGAGAAAAPLDPTVAEPTPAAPEPTAAWSTAPTAPAPPPPYTPADAAGPGDGESNRKLLIGGGVLAAIALAVLLFFALSDDDSGNENTSLSGDVTTSSDGGSTDGAEEDLLALRDECAGGDFPACDDLYFRADLGSDLEKFGSTCGGKADEQGGFCEETNGGRDEFPSDDAGGLTDGLSDGLGDDYEDLLVETYEDMGLTREQAQCLAGKLVEAIEDGLIDETESATEFMAFLSECDVSLEDLGGN